MKLLLIYWAFLAAGYIAAGRLGARLEKIKVLGSLMMLTVYCLCFCMGMRMGVNEQVTSNLGSIGLMSLAITAACILGSMLSVFVLRKMLRMDRYGDLLHPKAGPARGKEPSGTSPEKEKDSLALGSTIILLSVVAAGMILGALVLARRGEDFLVWFDDSSNLAMVILLCILMALVGLDLGRSGDVAENLKKAGLRVLLFPVASMAGTMILGIGICLLLGFTLRESAAIPIGFGWYSYAPVVITNAGSRYVVAGAVSFMHNVMREVCGIILIPAAAKRFGYLEATTIPGIAAMDVCIPIVAGSCRADTVIYSFAIGLVMCLVTSVGVPVIMGV